ncbi:hypothetical protein MKX72_19930 [Priestia sp. FSL R5-0597]|uniref:hypothetical protein n=1 Tax=Priestia sp. FSL R5-0597 TaxID=2921580 RepID=UPI0030FB2FC7
MTTLEMKFIEMMKETNFSMMDVLFMMIDRLEAENLSEMELERRMAVLHDFSKKLHEAECGND